MGINNFPISAIENSVSFENMPTRKCFKFFGKDKIEFGFLIKT